MTRVALAAAVLCACSVYEDHVRIVPVVVPEEDLDCETVCADPEIHSVNFCTVATTVA